MPRVAGLMRSRIHKRLASLADGFSPATEARLALPEELGCLEADGVLVYATDCEATVALAAEARSARARKMPAAVYGLCLYDHAGATLLLLHDVRRRILVNTTLSTIGEHERSPWKRIDTAVEAALRSRGAGEVGVYEHGVLSTMPAAVFERSPARGAITDVPCGGPWELSPIVNRIECEIRVLASPWDRAMRRRTVGADPRIERVAIAVYLIDAVAELARREKEDLRAVRRARIVLVESMDFDFWSADLGSLGRVYDDICGRLRAAAAIDLVDHDRAVAECAPRVRRRIEAIQDVEAPRPGDR